MTRPLLRQVLLTVLAIGLIGGAGLSLAVSGGRMKRTAEKRSLSVQSGLRPIPIRGLAPGDTAETVVVIRNRGRSPMRRMRFELNEKRTAFGTPVAAPAGRATPDGYRWERRCITVRRAKKRIRRCRTALRPAPSPLITDRSGLRVTLQVCSVPWRAVRSGTALRFSCRGRTRTVMGATRVPARRVLRRLPGTKPGGRLHVRMTIALPADAGGTLQGRTALLVPKFAVPGAAR